MKTFSKQSSESAQPSLSASLKQQQTLPLPPLLSTIAVISLLLTIFVGGALFFFPDVAQPRWLWPLKPYNTRFLGAIYLTGSAGFISLLSGRGRAIARLIVPMLFVFTTNALMVSGLQLQQFAAARRATDIWFWLYIADCAGSAYYLGYFRQHTFASLRRLPKLWSAVLGVEAGLLGAYGLGLLLLPEAAGSRWLWPIDIFHSQLYSSLFLAGAVGAAILAKRATAGELRALGAVQLTFSSLAMLGVWLVDREVSGIDWSLLVNWVWMGAIALLGLVGLGLIKQSSSVKTVPDSASV